MKLIKITTNNTEKDINYINDVVDDISMEKLQELHTTFEYVQFCSKEKTASMYAVLSEKTINILFSEYVKYGIDFHYEDISKFVLFGGVPEIEGELEKADLNIMIKQFVEENLSTDIVLDKINEIGFCSLTEQDKIILEDC